MMLNMTETDYENWRDDIRAVSDDESPSSRRAWIEIR